MRFRSWATVCLLAIGAVGLAVTTRAPHHASQVPDAAPDVIGPGCYVFRPVGGVLHVAPLRPCTDPDAVAPGPLWRPEDIQGSDRCQEVDVESTGSIAYGPCPSP